MSARFYITSMQLELLTKVDLPEKEKRKIYNEVFDNQFLGNEYDVCKCKKLVKKK